MCSDNLGILIGGGEWRSGHGETATLTHPPPTQDPAPPQAYLWEGMVFVKRKQIRKDCIWLGVKTIMDNVQNYVDSSSRRNPFSIHFLLETCFSFQGWILDFYFDSWCEIDFAVMKVSMSFHGSANLQKTFHTLSSLFWQRRNGKQQFYIQWRSPPRSQIFISDKNNPECAFQNRWFSIYAYFEK